MIKKQIYGEFHSKLVFEELENYERANNKFVKRILANLIEDKKNNLKNINHLRLNLEILKSTINNQKKLIDIQKETIKTLEELNKQNN